MNNNLDLCKKVLSAICKHSLYYYDTVASAACQMSMVEIYIHNQNLPLRLALTVGLLLSTKS